MILKTVTLFVIAGILSSAIANQKNSHPGNTVSSYLRLFGYVNTTTADIERYDEELCRKRGGPTAYEEQKRSWDQWTACMHSVANEVNDELSRKLATSWASMSMDVAVRGYCQRVPKFENCFKNLTNSIKTCLDPDKHESANIIYNSISSMMRYLCEDNGEEITEFLLARGGRCLRTKQEDVLIVCANQTIFKQGEALIPNGTIVGGLGTFHLLVPNMNKCRIMENFQHCTVNALKNCTQTEPADLVNSLFNIVKRETTCEHLLKSGSSPIPIVNILLMTVTTAISLRFVHG